MKRQNILFIFIHYLGFLGIPTMTWSAQPAQNQKAPAVTQGVTKCRADESETESSVKHLQDFSLYNVEAMKQHMKTCSTFDPDQVWVQKELKVAADIESYQHPEMKAAQQAGGSVETPGSDANNSVPVVKPVPVIGWHGLELGQAVTPTQPGCGPQWLGRCKSNQPMPKSNPISMHTDCLSKDDEELESRNANDDLRGKDRPLYYLFMQEVNDYKAGKRLSYCYWSTQQDINAVKDRIRMIVVETREAPQDVIMDMTKRYGPPRGVYAPATTVWLWEGPNVATRRIFVKALEAQDPQTLERFVTTEIIFQLLSGTPQQ